MKTTNAQKKLRSAILDHLCETYGSYGHEAHETTTQIARAVGAEPAVVRAHLHALVDLGAARYFPGGPGYPARWNWRP